MPKTTFTHLRKRMGILPPISNSKFLLLLTSLFISGCIDEPVSPVWDVQLNAPVTNKKYTLMEVIEKDSDSTLKYDATNNLYYADDQPITGIVVEDKLKLNPSVANAQFSIQKLSINPAPFTTNVALSQLGSGFNQSSQGVVVPIPYVKQTVTQNLAPINDFEEMVLEDGTMNLTISNNTTGTCSLKVHGVTIVNVSDNSVVFANTDSIMIIPGESKVISRSLAGKTMRNSLKASLTISTVAGNSKIEPAETIGFSFAMVNLSPSRMKAKIPAQDPYSNSSFFDLDQNSRIKLVTVKKGKLVYTLKNNFKASVNAFFSIPELKTSSGAIYSNTVTLGPDESKPISITDLNGWSLQSTDGSYTGVVKFNVTTAVLPTTTAVEITKSDNVSITVNMDTLVLKRVDGKLKPTQLTTKTTAIALNLGSLKNFTAETILFNKFVLDINLGMSANTKIRLDNATVVGKNNVRTRSINIASTLLNGGGSMQKITIPQTQLNDFINAFVNKPPDSLLITYNATVNPNSDAIIINDADSVYGNSNMEIPLHVGIKGGTITDTTEINIPESNKEKLDNILSGTIKLQIENGLPAEVVFTGKLYDATGNFLMNLPPGSPASITVAAAAVNALGVVSKATNSEVVITLNTDQIKKFVDSKSMIISLQFFTTGGQAVPVKFLTSDYIKVYAAGQLNYRNKP